MPLLGLSNKTKILEEVLIQWCNDGMLSIQIWKSVRDKFSVPLWFSSVSLPLENILLQRNQGALILSNGRPKPNDFVKAGPQAVRSQGVEF